MLGRSLLRHLSKHPLQYSVLGTGLTRATPPLRRLDLLDPPSTSSLLKKFRPHIVVHCAAERDPDAFQKDPRTARRLNVDATASLAAECGSISARLFYLSTSYVFDGGAVTGVYPPYKPDARTHPLNGYGESKLGGEVAATSVVEAKAVIIRVPLLFGEDCASLSESAALSIAECFVPEKLKPVQVDNWALRFPTSVEDVSAVICRMIGSGAPPGIYHVSSSEGITKFGLAKMQAEILGLEWDTLNVLPGDGPPKGSAPRPQCTQLDCSDTWKVLSDGDGKPHEFAPLRAAMARALDHFRDRFE